MMLSDRSIRQRIGQGHIVIDPMPEDSAFQPASVDVRLGHQFRVFDPMCQLIDPASGEDYTRLVELPEPGVGHGVYVLPVGGFVLGHTVERLELPDFIAGQIDGKSTMARLGLSVHSTAGFLDPGWEGQVTLELTNHAPAPIALRPGMSIGQLLFWGLSSPSERPYGAAGLGSRYRGSLGPVQALSVNPTGPPVNAAASDAEIQTVGFDAGHPAGGFVGINGQGRPIYGPPGKFANVTEQSWGPGHREQWPNSGVTEEDIQTAQAEIMAAVLRRRQDPREAPMTITRAERRKWGV